MSDIHANLPALNAVLADIARQPEVPATYHLGDLVGYAPWPMLDVTAADVQILFRRVEYDLEATMRGIRESSLPNEFAEYSRLAGSPSRQWRTGVCFASLANIATGAVMGHPTLRRSSLIKSGGYRFAA